MSNDQPIDSFEGLEWMIPREKVCREKRDPRIKLQITVTFRGQGRERVCRGD